MAEHLNPDDLAEIRRYARTLIFAPEQPPMIVGALHEIDVLTAERDAARSALRGLLDPFRSWASQQDWQLGSEISTAVLRAMRAEPLGHMAKPLTHRIHAALVAADAVLAQQPSGEGK